jgi:hypothetical protein
VGSGNVGDGLAVGGVVVLAVGSAGGLGAEGRGVGRAADAVGEGAGVALVAGRGDTSGPGAVDPGGAPAGLGVGRTTT